MLPPVECLLRDTQHLQELVPLNRITNTCRLYSCKRPLLQYILISVTYFNAYQTYVTLDRSSSSGFLWTYCLMAVQWIWRQVSTYCSADQNTINILDIVTNVLNNKYMYLCTDDILIRCIHKLPNACTLILLRHSIFKFSVQFYPL